MVVQHGPSRVSDVERYETMNQTDASIDVTVGSPKPEDDRVAQAVVQAVITNGRFPIRRLAVRSADGTVTLRGRVSSYYHKQLAQTAALAVIGPRHLVNDIEVA
jgi:osmotically-inducible protein OsmY